MSRLDVRHCQLRGNDPVCEARKAACQVPVVGPIITGPGMPAGPGGPLGPGGPGVGPLSGEDIKGCFTNPAGCPAVIISSVAYSQLAFVVDQYIQFLEREGNGRWQVIPYKIITGISNYYPEVNLASVKFATDINTISLSG